MLLLLLLLHSGSVRRMLQLKLGRHRFEIRMLIEGSQSRRVQGGRRRFSMMCLPSPLLWLAVRDAMLLDGEDFK